MSSSIASKDCSSLLSGIILRFRRWFDCVRGAVLTIWNSSSLRIIRPPDVVRTFPWRVRKWRLYVFRVLNLVKNKLGEKIGFSKFLPHETVRALKGRFTSVAAPMFAKMARMSKFTATVLTGESCLICMNKHVVVE